MSRKILSIQLVNVSDILKHSTMNVSNILRHLPIGIVEVGMEDRRR